LNDQVGKTTDDGAAWQSGPSSVQKAFLFLEPIWPFSFTV
jgi:hypothetical protein